MSWQFSVPANHLISGLVVRYYSDQRPWFQSAADIQTYYNNNLNPLPSCPSGATSACCAGSTQQACVAEIAQKNSMVRIFQTQMIDIDTVFISNPIEPTQIYKPIEYRTGSDTPQNLQSNDVWEVKFPKGWYLFWMETLTAPSGGLYGISLVAANFFDPPQTAADLKTKLKIFQIGQGWSYSWGPVQLQDPKKPFVYLYKPVPDPNDSTFNPQTQIGWMTKIGGQKCTRDPMNQTGNFMTFDVNLCQWSDPANWSIQINYPNDYNYQCCWGLDNSRCGKYVFPNHQNCYNATKSYCDSHPTDYWCKRRTSYYQSIGITVPSEGFQPLRESFAPSAKDLPAWQMVVLILIILIGLAYKYNKLDKTVYSVNVSGEHLYAPNK